MNRIRFFMVGLLALTTALVPSMAGGSSVSTTAQDYSVDVDFTNTGLDKYNVADAALLSMTSPDRVKDPGKRAEYQLQLDSLKKAQAKAKAQGESIFSVSSPNPVLNFIGGGSAGFGFAMQSTIDPGCQLTSSYPGGLDLCAFDSAGDTMSLFGSGRKHVMWAAVQESDTQPISPHAWRGWWKSQAYGLSSDNVDHHVDLLDFDTLSTVGGGPPSDTIILGSVNPAGIGPCSPCYGVGSFRDHSSSRSYGDAIIRDGVSIVGTNDNSTTNNPFGSGWWWRTGGNSWWPGPYGYSE